MPGEIIRATVLLPVQEQPLARASRGRNGRAVTAEETLAKNSASMTLSDYISQYWYVGAIAVVGLIALKKSDK